MIINCAIIDDENFSIEDLKFKISEANNLLSSKQIVIKQTFNNTFNAIQNFNADEIDLLFIDYEMPGYTGLELINKLNFKKSIIFVSSYKEKSIEIINQLNILGFLPKPAKVIDIAKIINEKFNLDSYSTDKIQFINNNKTEVYNFTLDEIYYIESDGKYKNVIGAKKQKLAMIDSSFNNLNLDNYFFTQINRGTYVNEQNIRLKNKKEVKLKDETTLEIGVSEKKDYLSKFKNLFKK